MFVLRLWNTTSFVFMGSSCYNHVIWNSLKTMNFLLFEATPLQYNEIPCIWCFHNVSYKLTRMGGVSPGGEPGSWRSLMNGASQTRTHGFGFLLTPFLWSIHGILIIVLSRYEILKDKYVYGLCMLSFQTL